MGSSSSTQHHFAFQNAEKAFKAAVLIQRWYRRYVARLEMRRRCTWSIFQSIEYAGQQDQVKLHHFFSYLVDHFTPRSHHERSHSVTLAGLELCVDQAVLNPQRSSCLSLLKACVTPARPGDFLNRMFSRERFAGDIEAEKGSEYETIEVPDSYAGPHLSFPLLPDHATALVEAFRLRQVRSRRSLVPTNLHPCLKCRPKQLTENDAGLRVFPPFPLGEARPLWSISQSLRLKACSSVLHPQLHARYVLNLLYETRKHLAQLPNINRVSTCYSEEVTVCGDLHGQLDDLIFIFYKNGLPSPERAYVFNGDFVDRGKDSVEILMVLFAFMLVYPKEFHLNRGNHEDHAVNLRYGFTKEVMHKYKIHGKKILRILQDVFCWLPLATLVDEKVLILHGGVSDRTNLELLAKMDRHKVVDILWSDPMAQEGCKANTLRGGGCYFGPDVTEQLLEKYKLHFLIRSHECKPEGYEFCHNRKVLTIFSASNYYEVGSNRGAYVKLGPTLTPHIVQYQANKATYMLTMRQRISRVEQSGLRALRQTLFAHSSDLLDEFRKHDADKTGVITLSNWAAAVESVLHLGLPWRMLRPQLVNSSTDNALEYKSWLESLAKDQLSRENIQSSLLEKLYRNRSNLETIFRIIDSDHSGFISLDEFRQTWKLFSSHMNIDITDDSICDLARSIDFNNDGHIDINEFLEAFRLVERSCSEGIASACPPSTDTGESGYSSPGTC